MSEAKPVLVEISPGELFDKITVLEVKTERITEPEKLEHIALEMRMLVRAREGSISPSEELDGLVTELRSVNAELYDVIDGIYQCERSGDVGDAFVHLARSVYRLNDRRALLKRQINQLLGSRLMEQKGHLVVR